MNTRFSDAFAYRIFTHVFILSQIAPIFLRNDVPLSSNRCALCINLSRMASASVASPMDACHSLVGN